MYPRAEPRSASARGYVKPYKKACCIRTNTAGWELNGAAGLSERPAALC